MARGINKVILVGNLGQDPDMRQLPSGGSVANFSLATSENWNDANGQRQERTEWHRVAVFNKLAEIVGQYLRKGSQVYIEGSLRTREWEKDGIKRYTTEIICRELQMLGSRTNDGFSGSPPPAAAQQNTSAPQQTPNQADQSSASPDFGDLDDDIPF